ncbi:type IV secretion system protein [Sodalis endosymbiont of Spalangia cameroni]|uniref:type IV secretion system protein n=1 Tax=Sodalis praecaptivus TaxID=1239307 RepID=UPI0031F8E77B
MKRQTIAACLGLSLITSACFPVVAGGIPTVSVAELTQMVKNAQQQAREALAQLDKAKESIAQAKSQYEHYKGIVEGNDRLGDFLNDPTLKQLLPVSDWQDIYHQAKDLPTLRNRYGLTSRDPNVQAAFDRLLSQAGTLEEQYKATNKRIETAEGLRRRLNGVETPKEREQLALRYQQEMVEMQMQQMQLQNARYLMEQQEKIEKERFNQEVSDYYDGKSNKLPQRH